MHLMNVDFIEEMLVWICKLKNTYARRYRIRETLVVSDVVTRREPKILIGCSIGWIWQHIHGVLNELEILMKMLKISTLSLSFSLWSVWLIRGVRSVCFVFPFWNVVDFENSIYYVCESEEICCVCVCVVIMRERERDRRDRFFSVFQCELYTCIRACVCEREMMMKVKIYAGDLPKFQFSVSSVRNIESSHKVSKDCVSLSLSLSRRLKYWVFEI